MIPSLNSSLLVVVTAPAPLMAGQRAEIKADVQRQLPVGATVLVLDHGLTANAFQIARNVGADESRALIGTLKELTAEVRAGRYMLDRAVVGSAGPELNGVAQ